MIKTCRKHLARARNNRRQSRHDLSPPRNRGASRAGRARHSNKTSRSDTVSFPQKRESRVPAKGPLAYTKTFSTTCKVDPQAHILANKK